MTSVAFTVNIQKGGALLPDARRLVQVWDMAKSVDANIGRIADENLLGKATRRRLDDVLLRCLRPRFVETGPGVIAALKDLLTDDRGFIEAAYYETSRDEALLAAFAEGPCFGWYEAGRARVTVDDATAWLSEQVSAGLLPQWSPTVRTKVGRGLLAALRDFQVLEGANIKRFSSPALSLRGFAYVAFRLHEQGSSATNIVTSPVWRRWLLTPDRVDDLLDQAAQAGVFAYANAGTAVRIDWHVGTLEDAIHAAA
jgi:Putative inner membrane protein (DUF1819)